MTDKREELLDYPVHWSPVTGRPKKLRDLLDENGFVLVPRTDAGNYHSEQIRADQRRIDAAKVRSLCKNTGDLGDVIRDGTLLEAVAAIEEQRRWVDNLPDKGAALTPAAEGEE